MFSHSSKKGPAREAYHHVRHPNVTGERNLVFSAMPRGSKQFAQFSIGLAVNWPRKIPDLL
jgi:hypothetical protein